MILADPSQGCEELAAPWCFPFPPRDARRRSAAAAAAGETSAAQARRRPAASCSLSDDQSSERPDPLCPSRRRRIDEVNLQLPLSGTPQCIGAAVHYKRAGRCGSAGGGARAPLPCWRR